LLLERLSSSSSVSRSAGTYLRGMPDLSQTGGYLRRARIAVNDDRCFFGLFSPSFALVGPDAVEVPRKFPFFTTCVAISASSK